MIGPTTSAGQERATLLRPAPTHGREWSAYLPFVDPAARAEVEQLAFALRGCRVVHVNATPTGGGVAEMLVGLIPVLRSLGVDAAWYTLPPDEAFFQVTKRLHNALQGDPNGLSTRSWQTYQRALERVATGMRSMTADVWVIHDPQPLALQQLVPLGSNTLWRCHIDCSSPNQAVAARLAPWVGSYTRSIFSDPAYVLPGVAPAQTAMEFPAIDPLTVKNRPLDPAEARAILAKLGLDPGRPIVTQVSRFDPWKNPWQVLDAYRLAKQSVPDLQLAMVGVFAAKDDPEGPLIYESIRERAGADPDIHLFIDPARVAEREVNAFQTGSSVILQRSTREGFGLVVTEAMWKGRPVVATPVGGIKHQIEHGHSGVLVEGLKECADWIVRLIQDPDRAEGMGQAARDSVRRRFLLPRLVRDELALYAGAA
jgi:trehalose synthase